MQFNDFCAMVIETVFLQLLSILVDKRLILVFMAALRVGNALLKWSSIYNLPFKTPT